MGFGPILEELIGDCPGALGAVLLGKDGIAVAQATRSVRDPLAEDFGVLGAEFSRVLAETRRAAGASGAGEVAEAWFHLDRFRLGLCRINADLVLALVVEANGNLGQARYLIRRNRSAILSQA